MLDIFHSALFRLRIDLCCITILNTHNFRKYISVNPKKLNERNCQKLYANVYSTSMEEDGALICCVKNEHQSTINESTSSRNVLISSLEPHWWDSLSYEGYLCNQKVCVLILVIRRVSKLLHLLEQSFSSS